LTRTSRAQPFHSETSSPRRIATHQQHVTHPWSSLRLPCHVRLAVLQATFSRRKEPSPLRPDRAPRYRLGCRAPVLHRTLHILHLENQTCCHPAASEFYRAARVQGVVWWPRASAARVIGRRRLSIARRSPSRADQTSAASERRGSRPIDLSVENTSPKTRTRRQCCRGRREHPMCQNSFPSHPGFARRAHTKGDDKVLIMKAIAKAPNSVSQTVLR